MRGAATLLPKQFHVKGVSLERGGGAAAQLTYPSPVRLPFAAVAAAESGTCVALPSPCRNLVPIGVGEGDVVEARPVGKDPLLRDEPVVVARPAPLIVDIGGTFIRTFGFIVVVWQLVRWRLPTVGEGRGGGRGQRMRNPQGAKHPSQRRISGKIRLYLRAVVRGNHPVNMNVVTQLYSDHHGEPSRA